MTRESLIEDCELLLSFFPSPYAEKVKTLCIDDARTAELWILRHKRAIKIATGFSSRLARERQPEIHLLLFRNALHKPIARYEALEGGEMILQRDQLKADGDVFRQEIERIFREYGLIE